MAWHALTKDPTRHEHALLDAISREPEGAEQAAADGSWPLHQVVRRRPPLAVVRALIAAYPAAAAAKDLRERTPLHWAAERKASPGVLSALLEAHIEACRAVDADGSVPLHLASANPGADAEEADARVAALIGAHPASSSAVDRAGRTPLHYAAARKAPASVVRRLLDALGETGSVEAALLADADGRTPLQIAADFRAPLEVQQLIERASASYDGPPATGGSPEGSAALAAHGYHYNEELRAVNVWELDVPIPAIDEARAVFERCGLREAFVRLREERRPHARIGGGADDESTFFAVRAGGGESDGVGSFRGDISWISVDSAATHAAFERLFERTGVAARLAPHVEHSAGLVMYSAFFVVRSECASPNFHVDYAREVGLNALTLMTPLDDVDDSGGFQLLYNESEPTDARLYGARGLADAPPPPPPPPGPVRRYAYRRGKAICFGAGFRHSTEPGAAADRDAPHAYLCFTFGTDRPEHWPAIARTIDGYQSRMLKRPDGAFVLSQLGQRIESRAESV